MKFTLVTLVIVGLSLGNNPAFSATNKCKYERMKDLSAARNAKGKKRKGYYIDDFTKELVVSTNWADISHPARPSGREMTGFVSARSQGDMETPEVGHDKFLSLRIEYLRPKRTFPTDDEVQNSISVPENGELHKVRDALQCVNTEIGKGQS